MYHFVYFFLDHYPWWAVPLALISLELANHFRRKDHKPLAFVLVGISLALVISAVLFVVYDGLAGSNRLLDNVKTKILSKMN